MHYIKINPRMRIAGMNEDKEPIWFTTPNFISIFVRAGKQLNTGLNILEAKKIMDACDKALEKKQRYVALEDTSYNLLSSDIKNIEFGSIGVSGIQIVKDVQNVVDSLNKEPDDFDKEITYVYPDPALSTDPIKLPENALTYIETKKKSEKFIDKLQDGCVIMDELKTDFIEIGDSEKEAKE